MNHRKPIKRTLSSKAMIAKWDGKSRDHAEHVTADALARTVLALVREAGMPVAENLLPVFVRRELGTDAVSDAAVIGAAVALTTEGKLMNAGTGRGSRMLALAW